MRLPIHLQREVTRLHYYDPSQSSRAIGGTLGISPNTVGTLRALLQGCRHPWNELESLDDDQWCQAIGTSNRSSAQRKEAPDWEWVHGEMQRKDATLDRRTKSLPSQNHRLKAWQKRASMYGVEGRSKSNAFAESLWNVGLGLPMPRNINLSMA